MTKLKARPANVYILFLLLAFQGLSAIYGGVNLIMDTTGESLNMPVSYLDGSPFSDYFIPGLILLTILGIYPLLVLYNGWKRDRTAWFGSLIVGYGLVIWILVEILMIGYQSKPPLQIIYGSLGILILFFSYLPYVKKYLKITD